MDSMPRAVRSLSAVMYREVPHHAESPPSTQGLPHTKQALKALASVNPDWGFVSTESKRQRKIVHSDSVPLSGWHLGQVVVPVDMEALAMATVAATQSAPDVSLKVVMQSGPATDSGCVAFQIHLLTS